MITFHTEAAKRVIEQDTTLLMIFERTSPGLCEAVKLEIVFENYIRGDGNKEFTYQQIYKQLTKQTGGHNATAHRSSRKNKSTGA